MDSVADISSVSLQKQKQTYSIPSQYGKMNDDLVEVCKKYIAKSDEALSKLSISVPIDSYLETLANDFMTMIKSYVQDAKYLFEKGDLVKCISAINYAYGWIDSGARVGLFDVSGDHTNFTLFK